MGVILSRMYEFLTENWVGQLLLGVLLFTLLVWYSGFVLRFGWDAGGRFAARGQAEAEKQARAAKRALPSLRERLRHLEDAGPRYRTSAKSVPSGDRDEYLMKWKKHAAVVSRELREKEETVAEYERRYGKLD